VVNRAIYSVASYDFFVARPSCYIINQQLQWAAYVVLKVGSTYHKLCYSARLLTTLVAHWIKRVHNFYFILVMSRGLGMCDSLNSLVCKVIWGSSICLIKFPRMLSEVCFIWMYEWMYEKRTARIKLFILRLMIQCALWTKKYGSWCDASTWYQSISSCKHMNPVVGFTAVGLKLKQIVLIFKGQL